MPHLLLGWRIALVGSLALLAVGALLAVVRPTGPRGRFAVAAVTEWGIVLGLFTMWQVVGTLAHHSSAGAIGRGEDVLAVERHLHIASEHATQSLVLGHPWLVQACNGYYLYGHLNGLAIFLVWVFLWHRRLYPSVRLTVVLLTAACFCVHFVPVAPPRLLPGAGFVDTARQYGESVYGPATTGLADQLSALPSMHVGWAALIAWWAWRASPWRWGWAGMAHLALTSFVVVATANHYWLDGIAAMAVLALVLALQAAVPASSPSLGRPPRQGTPVGGEPEPEPVPAG
ncbi:MAG: hypothetical protein QOE01_1978 [Actinomycetota bacterium]|jgi:hypothetical protein|nr:hypothetical protein [Actinomycetota bacterium]